jgi:hypothetical protein
LTIFPIDPEPLSLHVRPVVAANVRSFVPVQAKIAQTVQKPVNGLRIESLLVSIFYSQNELPAVVASKQVIK